MIWAAAYGISNLMSASAGGTAASAKSRRSALGGDTMKRKIRPQGTWCVGWSVRSLHRGLAKVCSSKQDQWTVSAIRPRRPSRLPGSKLVLRESKKCTPTMLHSSLPFPPRFTRIVCCVWDGRNFDGNDAHCRTHVMCLFSGVRRKTRRPLPRHGPVACRWTSKGSQHPPCRTGPCKRSTARRGDER